MVQLVLPCCHAATRSFAAACVPVRTRHTADLVLLHGVVESLSSAGVLPSQCWRPLLACFTCVRLRALVQHRATPVCYS